MDTIETNSVKAWMLATRPKPLAAAVAPVILGTAIGFQQEGTIKIIPAVICLLFAVLMQAAANLINDLIDYQKGSDGEERLGPMRATAQGWITPLAMKIGIATFIGTACLIGLGILYYTSWHIIGVGILCAIFAYFYTSITFNPMEVADNMKKQGGFIPGIRPGKSTVDYLNNLLSYIIFIGAAGLTIVAVIPFFFNGFFKANVSFGGTSLIIIASVILETLKQIESMMLVRNYKGFLND